MQPSSSDRELKVWMGCSILAALFVVAAIPKLFGIDFVRDAFESWNYPLQFMYIVGILELAGALLIMIPGAARFGFGVLIFIMCGAIITHLIAGQFLMMIVPAALLLFI